MMFYLSYFMAPLSTTVNTFFSFCVVFHFEKLFLHVTGPMNVLMKWTFDLTKNRYFVNIFYKSKYLSQVSHKDQMDMGLGDSLLQKTKKEGLSMLKN